jgi:hypothetical protein
MARGNPNWVKGEGGNPSGSPGKRYHDTTKGERKRKINTLVEFGLDHSMKWLARVAKTHPDKALMILAQLLPYSIERKGVELSLGSEDVELLSMLDQLRALQGKAINDSVLGSGEGDDENDRVVPEGMLLPDEKDLEEPDKVVVRNASYRDIPIPEVPVQKGDAQNTFLPVDDDEDYDEFNSASGDYE